MPVMQETVKNNDRTGPRRSINSRGLLLLSLLAFLLALWVLFFAIIGARLEVYLTTAFLVTLNAIVWFLPAMRLLWQERFDLFHPLVFFAVFFGLPSIILRGMSIALGMDSDLLQLTAAPESFFDLALVYALVGWIATMVGFYLPATANLNKRLVLPHFIYSEQILRLFPLLTIFMLGLVFSLVLIVEGAFGASLSEFRGDLILVSIARPLSNWPELAFFLLVFGTVRARQRVSWYAALMFASIILVSLSLLSGSRAQLFYTALTAFAAFFYARRTAINWRRLIPWLIPLVIALFVGVLWVSQYRTLRLQEYRGGAVTTEQAAELIITAADQSSSLGARDQAQYVSERLLERFSAMEMLGVTLARANKVQQAEQAAGIDNNIMKELFYGFIPRPLWPGKPNTGEFGLWFSRIYLDLPHFVSNGPSIFGDLYRNFGFLGVPIGMFIVGIYLRTLYEQLILRMDSPRPLASVIFISLLFSLNWETTYPNFVTGGLRILFSIVIMSSVLALFGLFTKVPSKQVSHLR